MSLKGPKHNIVFTDELTEALRNLRIPMQELGKAFNRIRATPLVLPGAPAVWRMHPTVAMVARYQYDVLTGPWPPHPGQVALAVAVHRSKVEAGE